MQWPSSPSKTPSTAEWAPNVSDTAAAFAPALTVDPVRDKEDGESQTPSPRPAADTDANRDETQKNLRKLRLRTGQIRSKTG
ncbi:hypothetical protein VTI28DRAFT_9105 [Corynascus sepedonium]